MRYLFGTKLLISVVVISFMIPTISLADGKKIGKGHLKKHHKELRKDHVRKHRHKNKLSVVAPRKRVYKNKKIVRPYGHSYHGYGHYQHDDYAWRWLSLTAITLTVLDNLNEQAQREHEAAQIEAAKARVGERIVWETESATGYVVTTKEGVDADDGLTCREFQHTITVGGKTEDAYGTACLQEDGSWHMVQ